MLVSIKGMKKVRSHFVNSLHPYDKRLFQQKIILIKNCCLEITGCIDTVKPDSSFLSFIK